MKNGWYQGNYGSLIHYVNDKRHNKKCPSVIWDNGTKFWMQNDQDHRLDGPALESSSGEGKYWYYQNKIINCKSQTEFERYLRLKILW